MTDNGWRILTIRWATMFILLAITNEVARFYLSEYGWLKLQVQCDNYHSSLLAVSISPFKKERLPEATAWGMRGISYDIIYVHKDMQNLKDAYQKHTNKPLMFIHDTGRGWKSTGTFRSGLTTGASDDDPSGIATYSQTGAMYGFGLIWMSLFTGVPLMSVIARNVRV